MEQSARIGTSKRTDWKKWAGIVASVGGFAAFTIGMTVLFHTLSDRFRLPIYEFAWMAYLIVFATNLVSNLSIMAPAPLALSVTLAAAVQWNPLTVGLSVAWRCSLSCPSISREYSLVRPECQ